MILMNDSVLAAVAAVHVKAPGIVSATAAPPPGVGPKVDTVLSWIKWLAVTACTAGIFFVAARLAIANRRGQGEDSMEGLAKVLGGAILCGAGAGLIQVLQS